jgi:hypothetical protein
MQLIFLEKMGWEFRIPVIAAAAAMTLSLVAGFVSGNPAVVVVTRAFMFALLFGGLSFGGLTVLRKFVPELYEAIFSTLPAASAPAEEDFAAAPEEVSASAAYTPRDDSADTPGEAFDAPPKKEFAPTGLDQISAGAGGRKPLEENMMKFQPKIMAEAIRTMMSKDNE